MLFYPASTAGTLEVYAPARPDASPTVAVYDTNGSASVAAGTAATRDSVETTTSAGAGRGSVTLTLTTIASVVAGRRYLLGDAATGPTEEVLVLGVPSSGTQITLATPLLYDHASGQSFDGCRLSYAFTNAIFTSVGENFKAVFSWANGSAAQKPLEVAFAVSKHALASRVTAIDLQVCEPQLTAQVSKYTQWDAVLAEARRELDADITSRWLPWCLRGTPEQYEQAHKWRTLALLAEQFGQAFHPTADRYLKRYQGLLDAVVTLSNVDRNQDNAIAEHEGGTRAGRIRYK